jgi:DNA-binding HxlR family transcriptional regulator
MAGGNKENESKRGGGDATRAEVREPGRFAYQGLERVIHEKARLSILSSLAVHGEGLLFNDLKALCTLTDGNLSRQLQLLQEEGLVEVWKGFKNRRPQTLCRLTPEGRKRFLEYVTTLEKVVSDAAEVARQFRNVRLPAPEGFSPA